MGRPQSIAWPRRVAIFLAFRRFGKVYPAAKTCHVARATVTHIVAEFEQEGFSRQPRVSLPAEMLAQAQARHLAEVVETFRQFAAAPLFPELASLGSPVGEAPRGKQATLAWLLAPALGWHLKQTPAEGLLEQAETEVRGFMGERDRLWMSLRAAFEGSTGHAVVPFPAVTSLGQQPCYFEDLFTALQRECLGEDNLLRRYPPSAWEARGSQLYAGVAVAFGDPENHDALRGAAEGFLREQLGEFQKRAVELSRHRGDLGYVDEVVRAAMAAVSEEQLRRGICPECPYPEAGLAAEPPNRSRKRKGAA